MPLRFARAVTLATCTVALPFVSVAGQRHARVSLRAGQTVRVRLPDGQRFVAPLVGVDSNPIVLRFAAPHAAVPIAAADSVWLRRSSAGRGALVGGIVLGAGSLLAFSGFCQMISEGKCEAWGYVAGLTVAGAGVGALIGAGVGSLIPRWQRVDPERVTLSFGIGDRELRAGARIRF